jgi:hypothetical protein
MNEAEIHQRLEQCADLLRDSDALAAKLPANAQDGYFELVGYPVAITAAANERYFRTELARADVARSRAPGSNHTAASAAASRIAELTARYNNDIAGGKWRHIVTANGVSAKDWKRFQPDPASPRPDPDSTNVCPAAPPELTTPARPPGARPGDFFERGKVVSIHAGNFANRKDLPSGAGWRAVPGLGRTGSAVTVLPSTTAITSTAAPSLEYRFHADTGGPATLQIRLLPTYPLESGKGLRLAVSIDDGPPLPLAVTTGFEPKEPDWNARVLSNATEAKLKLAALKPGWHTLRLVAVDAGVVVDQIFLDFGGLQPSYLGPVETRIR